MKFSDQGIIINLKKYGEKSLIIKIFSQHHGVYKGFVKYASSSKNNQIFQIGNQIAFDYVARLEDSLGSFLCNDLMENYSSKFVFDKLRLNCAKSIISIIDNYFLERENFNILYQNFVNFLQDLGNSKIQDSQIIANFVKLELLILECLGYGIDLSSCVVTNSRVNLAYVSPKSAHAVSVEAGQKYADKLLKLPFFLAQKHNLETLNNVDNSDLEAGLKLSGFFLEKFLFSIDNLMFNENSRPQNSIYRSNIIKSLTSLKAI